MTHNRNDTANLYLFSSFTCRVIISLSAQSALLFLITLERYASSCVFFSTLPLLFTHAHKHFSVITLLSIVAGPQPRSQSNLYTFVTGFHRHMVHIVISAKQCSAGLGNSEDDLIFPEFTSQKKSRKRQRCVHHICVIADTLRETSN